MDKPKLVDRRKATTERQKRFRERQKAAGKKALVVYLSDESRDYLNKIRAATRETNSEIIERALIELSSKPKLIKRRQPQLVKRRKA